MKKHDLVKTPKGLGFVKYVRFAPPNYNEVEAVSVCLFDAQKNRLNYNGSLFPIEQVERIENNEN